MRSRIDIDICLVDKSSWKHIDKMGKRIIESPVMLEISHEAKNKGQMSEELKV